MLHPSFHLPNCGKRYASTLINVKSKCENALSYLRVMEKGGLSLIQDIADGSVGYMRACMICIFHFSFGTGAHGASQYLDCASADSS